MCNEFSDDDKKLIKLIEQQRNLMIAVSVGERPLINYVVEYIKNRDDILKALRRRGIQDPNPHNDLWDWFGKYQSGDLPTYKSRRDYISDIYKALINYIKQGYSVSVLEEATGWTKVDQDLSYMREQLAKAITGTQFQGVGHTCREIFISLAQSVYDPLLHSPKNGGNFSETDAKRMLEGYILKELSGLVNEELRKHAKASLALANALQHRRTANFRDAALCAEATSSFVNLIAIISGKRDPK